MLRIINKIEEKQNCIAKINKLTIDNEAKQYETKLSLDEKTKRKMMEKTLTTTTGIMCINNVYKFNVWSMCL